MTARSGWRRSITPSRPEGELGRPPRDTGSMVSTGSLSAAEQGRTISPRRTTTRHQFAPRGTWDRAAIVGAARAWAEETGAPPRSWEWCPSSARSAGLIGGAEHGWEREHPRWPGNTTVYRFFTSWGDLLEAAGLPPYQRRLPGPLADRIAAVRLLHDPGLQQARRRGARAQRGHREPLPAGRDLPLVRRSGGRRGEALSAVLRSPPCSTGARRSWPPRAWPGRTPRPSTPGWP